jgi:hypothetical protein
VDGFGQKLVCSTEILVEKNLVMKLAECQSRALVMPTAATEGQEISGLFRATAQYLLQYGLSTQLNGRRIRQNEGDLEFHEGWRSE